RAGVAAGPLYEVRHLLGIERFIRPQFAMRIAAQFSDDVAEFSADDVLAQVFVSQVESVQVMIVEEMTVRPMADIMYESRDAGQALDIGDGGHAAGSASVDQRFIEVGNGTAGQMHGAQDVLKAGMLGTG